MSKIQGLIGAFVAIGVCIIAGYVAARLASPAMAERIDSFMTNGLFGLVHNVVQPVLHGLRRLLHL